MSTPDPKTVREIAREHILDDAQRAHDIGADVLGHFGPDALTKHEYGAYCSAIREAIATATVTMSWPDEQQPADVVTAEQQQDGAVGGKGSVRAASLLAFLDLHRERRGHDVIASLAVGDGRTVELTQVQLRAVLAERTALAARVAESRDALTVAAELLDRFASETPCTVGGDTCREHGYTRKPCPHPLARQLVDAWRAVQAEDAALNATETEES